ncbi:MAG: polysaccharide deacetylase family protein [Desulfovibrio sp.]|jgi:peptidoglycan/xylan/chitin deacetylase (PgdA/CDA1 family)|nr:polysaccharide deacetylase family protein [Desulfovibrio sp.]
MKAALVSLLLIAHLFSPAWAASSLEDVAPNIRAPCVAGPRAPFPGLGLDRVVELLGQRFAGRAPAHWGELLPGVVSRLGPPDPENPQTLRLALTLDACGGPDKENFDAGIIALLREYRIPATIFVTSIWLHSQNPDMVRELAADPLFTLAAHGARHRPASVNGASAYGIKGTSSARELVREVEENARDITRVSGQRPRWYRSGTAYYDDVAIDLITELNLCVAGYAVAGDEGATLSGNQVAEKLLRAQDGDILLLHLNKPKSGTRAGLQKALPELLKRGALFISM